MLRIQQQASLSVLLKESVPLKQIHVDARLRSFAADVTLTQVFQNDESVPIEAVYCYVSELDLLHCDEKPTIRFVIPTTIAPRYSPAERGIASPGGTQANYVQSAPYTIKFDCQVDKLDQHVACISSPSHPIMVDFNDEDFFLVTLSKQDTQLDRDIIIDIELSKTRTNTIVAIEKSALMVSFMPNEEDCQRGSNNAMNEFLFVIDCSGSMNDDNKIGLARKAMLLFLKGLPVKCHFNIIRFGSNFLPLFGDQVTREYNEMNTSQAEALIQGMEADLGGTELLEPLRWLKKNHPPVGCVRQVFLLTDGEVSNVDQVINLCHEMASSTRIFSFGLGHSASTL
ncbi:unnamed protein product [Rotaria sp. Silwood2]|nr:unnamed protein product [Rotaria sp. Silwood2]